MACRNAIRTAIGAGVALSFAAAPAPALAGPFTPAGQQKWVATVQALIRAADTTPEDMIAACSSAGNSELRHRFFLVPKWASFAQFRTCSAYKLRAVQRRTVDGSGDACKTLSMAIDELSKAKAGTTQTRSWRLPPSSRPS